jgi:hypothetical protein
MRIKAHELAGVVGVAVAGASHAGLDVAEHRAGVAADLVALCRRGQVVAHVRLASASACNPARMRSGVAGARVIAHAAGVADRVEDGGGVGISACSPNAFRAIGAEGFAVLDEDVLDLWHGRRSWGSGSRAGSRCGPGCIPPSARGRGPARRRPRSGLRPARIDRAADIMRRGEAQHFHGPRSRSISTSAICAPKP